MSFFTKAAVAALKKYPEVNAEIDGDDMITKQFYDIGIAYPLTMDYSYHLLEIVIRKILQKLNKKSLI